MTVNWINKEFLTKVAETLHEIGFVTNEHVFTPYGKAISENVSRIQEALEGKNKQIGTLKSGKINSAYGTIYYIVDLNKLSEEKVNNVILKWIEDEYSSDLTE